MSFICRALLCLFAFTPVAAFTISESGKEVLRRCTKDPLSCCATSEATIDSKGFAGFHLIKDRSKGITVLVDGRVKNGELKSCYFIFQKGRVRDCEDFNATSKDKEVWCGLDCSEFAKVFAIDDNIANHVDGEKEDFPIQSPTEEIDVDKLCRVARSSTIDDENIDGGIFQKCSGRIDSSLCDSVGTQSAAETNSPSDNNGAEETSKGPTNLGVIVGPSVAAMITVFVGPAIFFLVKRIVKKKKEGQPTKETSTPRSSSNSLST